MGWIAACSQKEEELIARFATRLIVLGGLSIIG